MSRVITFSRTFPAYHPKAGQPTFGDDWSDAPGDASAYVVELSEFVRGIKNQTIRAGHRFKVGDKFSPRVWSGKPYNSKQIIIAPDIEVKKIFDFKITTEANSEMRDDLSNFLYINSKLVMNNQYELLAANDGLTVTDMCDWFKIVFEDGYKHTAFSGQIICWNENVNY